MEAAGGHRRMEKNQIMKNQSVRNTKMIIQKSRMESHSSYDTWKWITKNIGFRRANGPVDGLMIIYTKIAI